MPNGHGINTKQLSFHRALHDTTSVLPLRVHAEDTKSPQTGLAAQVLGIALSQKAPSAILQWQKHEACAFEPLEATLLFWGAFLVWAYFRRELQGAVERCGIQSNDYFPGGQL